MGGRYSEDADLTGVSEKDVAGAQHQARDDAEEAGYFERGSGPGEEHPGEDAQAFSLEGMQGVEANQDEAAHAEETDDDSSDEGGFLSGLFGGSNEDSDDGSEDEGDDGDADEDGDGDGDGDGEGGDGGDGE